MARNLTITLPPMNTPFLDPQGLLSTAWYNWFLVLQNRTGGTAGVSSSDTSITAGTAQKQAIVAQSHAGTATASAAAAQSAANTGISAAAIAKSTADSAVLGVATLNATSVLKASFQADGIAPLLNPKFLGSQFSLPLLPQAVDDSSAATAGVVIGGLYVSGNILMQRQI